MSSNNQFQRLEQLFHELESLACEERSRRLLELSEREPDPYPELLRLLGDSTRVDHGEQLIDKLIGVAGELTGEALQDPERVGPYRLKRLTGEGGMGRVYLAEQSEPVRRRVAVKLTRRGLDSHEAIVRFRAERGASGRARTPQHRPSLRRGPYRGGPALTTAASAVRW